MAGWRNKNTQEFVYLHMVKWFTPLLLILCPLAGYGQFGVNVKYLFGQSETLDLAHISQDGIQASLEYGFRLKQKRVEFHPGLGYRFTFFKEGNYFREDALHGYFNSIDLDLNTSVYPFDYAGDCHCPTFSKDGNLIKKGFFFEISPGLAYQTLHREFYFSDPQAAEVPIVSSNLVWKLSIGGGLDIGITETFTLTPIFSWTKVANKEWEGLNYDGSDGTLEDQSYLSAGLRFTYKPDPKRRRRF